ncbi:autotransporter outer membrane beta-barrel domain-containing protein, partial [Ochrobactrum quorumnocens]
SWSSISANSFRDAWNARVAVDDGDSLIGRLGLAAQYATAWKDDQGRFSQASVYGIANLYQAFLGGTTVNLSGVDFDTDNDRTWVALVSAAAMPGPTTNMRFTAKARSIQA